MVEMLADVGRSRRFSKGMGHFKGKFQVEGDIAHQPLLVLEKIEWLPFHMVSKYRSTFFLFVTMHACDGQTDKQNYDH